WAALGMCMLAVPAPAAMPAAGERPAAIEEAGLRSIAGWLRTHGVEGWMGADVADAMGVARSEAEDMIAARQRGFRSEQTLRVAQLVDKRELLLFMVQQPDGQVFFYLSSLRGGLQKAFVSIPGRNVVAPLGAAEAASAFRGEVLYWEQRISDGMQDGS